MANDHIDNESMNFGLKYCEQIFEDELLLLHKLDRYTFSTGFFDKSFEEIFDYELKFIVNDQACSSESENNKIWLDANITGVSPLSDLLIKRKRKKKRTKKEV